MRTRTAEVERIVELLDSGSYESATDLAKAVLSEALDMVARRDWLMVAERPWGDETTFCYGPLADQGSVKRLSKSLQGELAVFPLLSVAALEQRTALSKGSAVTHCASCGHLREQHDWPKSTARNCTAKRPTKCQCKAFEEAS